MTKNKKFKIGFILFLIISTGLIVYSNSIENEFVWDDSAFVVENEFIRDMGNLPLYFTQKQTLAKGSLAGQNYRPLVPLSYAIDYLNWGLNPAGYHITNLCFHIANSILVFFLILLITRDRIISLFASLIFLTHPLQTEAVTWISGRTNVLFLFFSLISLICYITYRKKERLLFLFFSALSFILALLSKEMAATLPLILIVYDRFYYRRLKVIPTLLGYLPFFAALETYLIVRANILGRFAQCAWWTGNMYTTLLTMLKSAVYYIQLLIWPAELCADHLEFPAAYSIKDPGVLASLMVLIALASLIFLLFRKLKYMSFAILWFFITLLPVMNIIPINILVAERFLYLPLVGYAQFIAVLFGFFTIRARNNIIRRSVIIMTAVALIVSYSLLTMARNTAWADVVTFNMDIIKKYPGNHRAHSNLADFYMHKYKNLDMAYEEIQVTLSLSPEHNEARISLAGYYVETGRPNKAIQELKYAIKMQPDLVAAYKYLGAIYTWQGNYNEAVRQYRKALALDGTDRETREALRELAKRVKGPEKSHRAWCRAHGA